MGTRIIELMFGDLWKMSIWKFKSGELHTKTVQWMTLEREKILLDFHCYVIPESNFICIETSISPNIEWRKINDTFQCQFYHYPFNKVTVIKTHQINCSRFTSMWKFIRFPYLVPIYCFYHYRRHTLYVTHSIALELEIFTNETPCCCFFFLIFFCLPNMHYAF